MFPGWISGVIATRGSPAAARYPVAAGSVEVQAGPPAGAYMYSTDLAPPAPRSELVSEIAMMFGCNAIWQSRIIEVPFLVSSIVQAPHEVDR